MDREPVDSSNIMSVGHNPMLGVLEVEFRNGTIVQYEGVGREVFDDLLRSESKGRYLWGSIRGRYPVKQV